MRLSQDTVQEKRRTHKGTDRGATHYDTSVTSFGVMLGRFRVSVAQVRTKIASTSLPIRAYLASKYLHRPTCVADTD